MSGLLPLEFVLTPPPGPRSLTSGCFFVLCVHNKQMSQKTPEWFIANLDKSDKVTLCLFGGWFVCRCQTSPCYFPSFLFFLVIFDFRICQESYFSSSSSVFPGTWPEHFHFKATPACLDLCVCACMYTRKCTCANVFMCVRARRRLSLNVCQAAELRDEDSSLKSSANIRWHLCLPLTQKRNSYLLSTLQRHTNETGRRKCTFWFCPREKVSEVNQAQREKQKQKSPQSMSVPYKTCFLPARCAWQMFLSATIKPSASIRRLKLIEHKSLKSLEKTPMFVNMSSCMCVLHESK